MVLHQEADVETLNLLQNSMQEHLLGASIKGRIRTLLTKTVPEDKVGLNVVLKFPVVLFLVFAAPILTLNPCWMAMGSIASDSDVISNATFENALENIYIIPETNRQAEVVDLISNLEEGDVWLALRRIISDGTVELGAPVAEIVLGLSGHTKSGILYDMVRVKDEIRDLSIPRSLVEQAIVSGKTLDLLDSELSAISKACILLGEKGDVSDIDLLRSAVHSIPSSWSLWNSLAKTGKAEPGDLELASEIMANTTYPKVTRVAASCLITQVSSAATIFARDQILDYVQSFCDVGVIEIVNRVNAGDRDWYGEFRNGIPLITMMRFLPEQTAEEIFHATIRCQNDDIRQVGGLVGAEEWPEEVLALEDGVLPIEDYLSLLVAIHEKQPDLREPILARVGDNLSLFETELAEYREKGYWLYFGFAARVFTGL
jgi:hypothetical protein